MLQDFEKEAINNLPKNFNKSEEVLDYNYMSSVRSEFSINMARKLIRGAIFLNILSMFFVFATGIVYISKPAPKIYVSTPSGKVYILDKLN